MKEKRVPKPQAIFDALNPMNQDSWSEALDDLGTNSAYSFQKTGCVILAFLEDMNDLKKDKYEFDDTMTIEYSNTNEISKWLGEEYSYFESCAEKHTDTFFDVYLMVKDPDSGSYVVAWSQEVDLTPDEDEEDEDS